MSDLDKNVKNILAMLIVLFRKKAQFPAPALDIEINTLIGALKIVEARTMRNGFASTEILQ